MEIQTSLSTHDSISQHTLEKRVLSAAIASREAYEELRGSLKDGDFGAAGQAVATCIEEYYACDGDAKNCPRDVLLERIRQSGVTPKSVKALTEFVQGLDEHISVPNLLLDVRNLRRYRIGDQLAGLLANRQNGKVVDDLITQYQELGNASSGPGDEDIYSSVPIQSLLDRHIRGGTAPFGLKLLDESCDGGARPGHHILVFARPEVGKTLLTLDLVSRYTSSGRRVLYFGNEDPMGDIVLRYLGRATGLERREILDNPSKAEELAFGRGYENFVGVNLAPGNFRDITRFVKKFSPDVVVIDQLRNVDVGDDNRVTALEKSAIGARNLAKSMGVIVVSVTQAGDSAEGKAFLELSDIDFSKTGIPGAIDLAIGIGATEEDKRHGFRHINLPKNKLGGQHTHFTVRFDTRTGLVEEV